MEKYIPEAYEDIIDELEPVINMYQLDTITVQSLVRSCVELEEQEIQPVTAFWKSKDGRTYSTKPSNIKVNLKFALSTIFRMRKMLEYDDFWMCLAVLHLIVDSFISATREINELASVVLVAVYRLQHGDEERIIQYTQEICPPKIKDKLTCEAIEDTLNELETWGCIACVEGEYKINETVTSSMIREYQTYL